MQDMRYLNLFGRITRVTTRLCLMYNNMIIFCVPRPLVSRAIGIEGKNIRKINEILGKKVKVIPSPRGLIDIKSFIENIISPVTFKELEITDNEIIVTAGSQNKAALIGRNKRRLFEMQKIIRDFFGKEFRII